MEDSLDALVEPSAPLGRAYDMDPLCSSSERMDAGANGRLSRPRTQPKEKPLSARHRACSVAFTRLKRPSTQPSPLPRYICKPQSRMYICGWPYSYGQLVSA